MKTGSVVSAAGLIDYQNGGVVSKTVVDKGAGTVTLFSFDRDQGLSEHTAPFDALVYVIEGTAEIRISGQPHMLHGGDLMIMPAGEPHALKAVERFKMMLVMIRAIGA